MQETHETNRTDKRGERGAGTLKFMIVMAILISLAFTGYNYVPVAYNAYLFKDLMQQNVDKAAALSQSGDWVKSQLRANAAEFGVPPNAAMSTALDAGRMQVRVQFTRPIQLLVYTYEYKFDETIKSRDLSNYK
jgi:hypothetical protein